MIWPASILPLFIWNIIASTADVVFPYPPTKVFIEALVCLFVLILEIKCFTYVVELGLNNINVPEVAWSSSFPTPSAIAWAAVDCAKS